MHKRLVYALLLGEVFCGIISDMKAQLFIDGENFIYKIEDSLISQGVKKHEIDVTQIDLNKLISLALPTYKLDKKRFYSAKLQVHSDTITKSRELIVIQRILKTNLEKQGFEFILAGKVMPQEIKVYGKSKTIFKEKGVDVRIAVDLVSLSCDKDIDTALICSSDSDLQPAIAELRKRGIEVIYVGFENSPNKGLTYTSNKTVLFRNSEIIQTIPKSS